MGSTSQDQSSLGSVRLRYAAVAAIVLLAILIRAAFLDQPLRYDEAQTFNRYVRPPGELTHYVKVNNHLLHTLLVWISTSLLGHGEWAIRLPAFLAGVVAVPLSFWLTRRLSDREGGWLAALGVAVHPFLVLFSTNARGYTLIVCFTLAMAIAISLYLESATPARLFWIAAWAVLGLWTNPGMLFPAAGLLLWLSMELLGKPGSIQAVVFRELLPLELVIAVGTLVAYAPSLLREDGFKAVFGNSVVRSLPAEEFLAGLPKHLSQSYSNLLRDVPSYVRWCWLVLLLAGGFRLLSRPRVPAFTFIPACLIGVACLLLLKQSLPFSRNWIFFIPLATVLADVGWTYFARRLSRPARLVVSAGGVVVLLLQGVDLVKYDRVTYYNDTGRFADVMEVTEFLRSSLKPNDFVLTRVPFNEPLDYHLRQNGMAARVDFRAPDGQAPQFVVTGGDDPRNPDTAGMVECFQTGETRVYRQSSEAER